MRNRSDPGIVEQLAYVKLHILPSRVACERIIRLKTLCWDSHLDMHKLAPTTQNMSERQLPPAAHGPDSSRRGLVGFCEACGRVLEPTDYLECAACYRKIKQAKRRYSRASAQRQLECALQRVQQLANEPLLCHWIPDAAILFGSMLDARKEKVGDVDLCITGDFAHKHGLETPEEMRMWASANAPASATLSDWLFYPGKAAYSFIKKGNTLLSLILRSEFESVGGGRPFPYEIVWARTGVDAGTLRATIDAGRPVILAKSIEERLESVREILGRISARDADTRLRPRS